MTRVLVADDSAVVRALVRRALEDAGFEVVEASDGAEAAIVAFGQLPDVVVTDLEMPLVSGTQLATLLRADPATREIPIVVLTGHADGPVRFWSLHTGADRFVAKDDGYAQLVAAVRQLVAQRGGEEHRRQPRPAGQRPLTAVDVLARIARHLDERLMETTLTAILLRRGAGADSLEGAARTVLETVAGFVDADALVLLTAEDGRCRGAFAWLERHLPVGVKELVRAAAQVAGLPEPSPPDAVVFGPPDTGAAAPSPPDPSGLYPLRLPGGRLQAVLVTAPRDPDRFADLPGRLLGTLAPHIALVLDNAHLAERLVELSRVDELTGVLNHRAILELLDRELAARRRYGRGLAVILADIDHFKRVNDRHGHLAGDRVLREVAQLLASGLRQADAIGRYGGEEFLMVLSESGLEEARAVAERLRKALAAHRIVLPDGAGITVTASFGVASAGEVKDPDPGRLLALADDRLYGAKGAGRNRVCP